MRANARPPKCLKEPSAILDISRLTPAPAPGVHHWVSHVVLKVQIINQRSQLLIQDELDNDILFQRECFRLFYRLRIQNKEETVS